MAADSRECRAFTFPGRGLFQSPVMPFGSHSARATFQRALHTVIEPEVQPHACPYLDDIVVIGATKEQHVENLREVFRRWGMLFVEKEYVPTQRKWGRYVTLGSRLIEKPHLKKVRKWAWDEKQEEALRQLKDSFTTAPLLACPDFSAKFVLQTDASEYGLGAVLTQTLEGQGDRWIDRWVAKESAKFPVYIEENGQLYRNLRHRTDEEDYIPCKLCVASGQRQRREINGVKDSPEVLLAEYVPRRRQTGGHMLTRQVAEPMAVLYADFVGPPPRSRHGNTILVFHDAFSKWVELVPLRRATTAQEVIPSSRFWM
ncbi:uncharacterized protein LOC135435262 [Drosophila montana]|uniref:uncharacterized protein LOC135435262 n=1 Tax=Drosophila montana TaxID=40370 RepID=UPI00313EC9C4